ncbi:Megakaryocyte-associated tyrosine-protein kinase [Eumeta japonica]|uniref:Tyrosine-protein kinase n=1 Tax=Eumeta variegata TaxID=151549 RepID=A0A4C1UZA0_EUMVA|nr:Megakaryocyte-associated tyrosine-protein kinase [Eumeta japonica]
MNSDVHRHQSHPPLAQSYPFQFAPFVAQHGVHSSAQGVGPCGWYSASAAAPTAPARLKRIQPPHQLPTGGGVSGSNGPRAPLSPTALHNSAAHNPAHNIMSSSSTRAAGGLQSSVMHTSQAAPAITPKGPSDVLATSLSQSTSHQPSVTSRLTNITQMPWHHGAIPRERAEALLSGAEDGVFLMRDSTNFPGDHTLCVRYRGRVEYYRVKWETASDNQKQGFTIDDDEFFDNLSDLVHHYLQDADGLCTQLVRCLPKMSPNGANNGALQPPYQNPPQPPPYPATPSVSSNVMQNSNLGGFQHSQHTVQYGQQGFPPTDQTDSAPPNCIPPQKFVDARWIIAERDLEVRENIGKGEFGDVMLGILNGSQKVAVKILKDREAANKFLAEASLMASLKHENLVRLLGLVFTSNGSTCIVTEHMAKGSLLDYLRSRGRHYVTQKHQINFAYDACCGMEYLEKQRVVHRDLAARNVLISREGTAKVADFGLARADRRPDDPHAQAKLPIKWTAPEALKFNPLADVVKHVERGYRMEAPEGCPSELYDVMRAAWDQEPVHRPTFQQTRIRLADLKDAQQSQPTPPQPQITNMRPNDDVFHSPLSSRRTDVALLTQSY